MSETKKKNVHSFPITSYGIILFHIDKETFEPKFLIYQRRDTYEYMDFLRGIWGNEKKLKDLFIAFSPSEKKRLREYTFDELWDDLWITKENKIHRDGYEKARKKYESVKGKISDLLDSATQSTDKEPPWGFPKGKKNDYSKESDKDCALREFEEETGLDISKIKFWGKELYVEIYKGNNGKSYRTFYYLAETKTTLDIKRVLTPNCIRHDTVSDEAEDAIWVTLHEASFKLAARRQTILKKIVKTIKDSQTDGQKGLDAIREHCSFEENDFFLERNFGRKTTNFTESSGFIESETT